MILNMVGGSAHVQCQHFTLSWIVTAPNNLVISDVHIPGGVLKGFVLLKDNAGNDEMQNGKYVIAYSSEEMALEKKMDINVYLSANGGLFKYTLINYYAYDQQNQTLTITQYGNDFFWDVGRYTLFVW